MPRPSNTYILYIWIVGIFIITQPSGLSAIEFQGITSYYIRLDHQFSSHRSHRSRLTMVPAENEFRAENFSPIFISGYITADPQSSDQTLDMLAKKNAFIQVLEQKGLRSAKTDDLNTIISYEGVVKSPMNFKISPYDMALEGFPYTARINFAPLAFPDQWDNLKTRYRIKTFFNDFILLFK